MVRKGSPVRVRHWAFACYQGILAERDRPDRHSQRRQRPLSVHGDHSAAPCRPRRANPQRCHDRSSQAAGGAWHCLVAGAQSAALVDKRHSARSSLSGTPPLLVGDRMRYAGAVLWQDDAGQQRLNPLHFGPVGPLRPTTKVRAALCIAIAARVRYGRHCSGRVARHRRYRRRQAPPPPQRADRRSPLQAAQVRLHQHCE